MEDYKYTFSLSLSIFKAKQLLSGSKQNFIYTALSDRQRFRHKLTVPSSDLFKVSSSGPNTRTQQLFTRILLLSFRILLLFLLFRHRLDQTWPQLELNSGEIFDQPQRSHSVRSERSGENTTNITWTEGHQSEHKALSAAINTATQQDLLA